MIGEVVDYTVPEEQVLFELTSAMLAGVHSKKSELYGKSWRKRGHFSALFQILRKVDRLENMMLVKGIDPGSEISGETIANTVLDLAAYSVMWLGLLAASNPSQVEALLMSEGCGPADVAATAELIQYVQKLYERHHKLEYKLDYK